MNLQQEDESMEENQQCIFQENSSSPLVASSEPLPDDDGVLACSAVRAIRTLAQKRGLVLVLVALVGFLAIVSSFYSSNRLVLREGGQPLPGNFSNDDDPRDDVLGQQLSPNLPMGLPAQWEPERVLEMYISQHSLDVLRAATTNLSDVMDRKFIVGRYSCPDYAGNLLHDFVDSLLIAMLSNRTLLWYFDTNPVNNLSACNELLRVASWVPSYNEWSSILHLPPTPLPLGSKKYAKHYSGQGRFVPVGNSFRYAHYPALEPKEVYDLSEPDEREFWYGDILLQQNRAFEFLSQLYGFENSTYAKELVPRLYAQGRAFLFVSTQVWSVDEPVAFKTHTFLIFTFSKGMLIRNSIEFTSEVRNSVQPYINDERNHRSIGIHSRHIRDKDDGSDVTWEIQCLDKILQATQLKDEESLVVPPCTVYVMSDRLAALEAIRRESFQRNCSVAVVDHDSVGPDSNFKKEHGPFAGAGFFRDWLVVSQARTGFIHYNDRSSSALVYETMVYDGITEREIDSPVLRCSIDWRHNGEIHLFNQ